MSKDVQMKDAEGSDVEMEPEVPKEPHEPFVFALLPLVREAQLSHGLRHNDHHRYRLYCGRRLRRLRCMLRVKCGPRGKYTPCVLPDIFTMDDYRFLTIPLMNAERAWAYATQLKQDNANLPMPNPRWRLHANARFAKAAKWASQLRELCEEHCDQRTQLEAQMYESYLGGINQAERENYDEALTSLQRCVRLCEQLAAACENIEHSSVYKEKITDLEPTLRLCRFHLGKEGEDENDTNAPAFSGKSDFDFHGQPVPVPAKSLRAPLSKAVSAMNDIGEDLEKFGEVGNAIGDVLSDVHRLMIADDEKMGAQWRVLEAFCRELQGTNNVVRTCLFMKQQLGLLGTCTDLMSFEARKKVRPEEVIRLSEILTSELQALSQLAEVDEMDAYAQLIANCRCFALGLLNWMVGEKLKAIALFGALVDRVEMHMPAAPCDTYKNMVSALDDVQSTLVPVVMKWNCRIKAATVLEETGLAKHAAAPKLDTFPPRPATISCKPLLLDLAFGAIEGPALSTQQKKTGITGKLKGVGAAIGGWWGRK